MIILRRVCKYFVNFIVHENPSDSYEKTYGNSSTMNHRLGKTFRAPFLPLARCNNNYRYRCRSSKRNVIVNTNFTNSRERGMLRISESNLDRRARCTIRRTRTNKRNRAKILTYLWIHVWIPWSVCSPERIHKTTENELREPLSMFIARY